VLVVDDEPFNIIALQGMLEHLGVQKVDKALNGREALEMIKSTPDQYDLIITDNQMPYMLGVDLARELRTMQD
jgi:CheY-like chemotaxis protein